MKLLRYGLPGQEKPGLLDENGILRDLSGLINDISGETLLPENLERLNNIDHSSLPEINEQQRLGPCVGQVGNFICIGLNYSDHAKEAGMDVPSEPVIFSKVTSAISGPNDNVIIPKNSSKADWEVELGVVVGKTAKYVDEKSALDHVAGYCVINDLTEREFQLERSGQWIMGKSCDTFGPIGPWLVTTDEVGDPQNLDIWLEVDGKRYQNGNTRTMIFGVAYLIHYLSQFFTLHPGDIISTGTPSGVGMGHKPNPIFLRSGQTMTLGIEKLGTQNQFTVDEKEVY
ncbi:MAG: fumarylacetoacetate hydrolase family protein [Thiotrichales bacterium]|jgi:2-keto-4-pentenoate hydratase/2-oxohepta-3-ene-1,7-dioic acid hydratase in catechol pathway|nr:fumarylacetoacetate hydrolase family protein [Thiotrichales bacterium]MBT3854601.1 fumarylacetoacetate hydrolase family protein [Thiotrichales bacterium]MBT4654174.1 fumarylacetoacetate hydrolase family protein [Thiotrichales bacterium]MBT5500336.1 fumarylacetoacetate hydrolase family protein [Thiotrichales bacterium]MBT5984857.1 fumarylacetoacetate hydrolase family protein [Thiotrichales bacterium]